MLFDLGEVVDLLPAGALRKEERNQRGGHEEGEMLGYFCLLLSCVWMLIRASSPALQRQRDYEGQSLRSNEKKQHGGEKSRPVWLDLESVVGIHPRACSCPSLAEEGPRGEGQVLGPLGAGLH